jgi:hypothetical protein
MYSEGGYANILQALSYVGYIFGIVVPSEAGFYRYRQVSGFDNGLRHLHHFRNILQQSRSGTPASHILYRTAIINIYQIGVYLGSYFGRHHHVFYFAAEQLNANGSFVLKNIQLLAALGGIADQSFRGYKFSIHQVGPVGFAYGPERRVAYIFHGCQQQRKFAQFYISYLRQNNLYLKSRFIIVKCKQIMNSSASNTVYQAEAMKSVR